MKTEGIARTFIAGERAMVAQLFAKEANVPLHLNKQDDYLRRK